MPDDRQSLKPFGGCAPQMASPLNLPIVRHGLEHDPFGKPPKLDRLIGASAARQLEAHFAEDNAILAERRGLPLREMGYPMPEAQAESIAFRSATVEMAE